MRPLLRAGKRAFLQLGAVLQGFVPRGELVPATTRAAFLREVDSTNCLEIGPFDCPQVAGPGVRYFDVLDRDALIERARGHGRSFGEVPVIDYVSPTGDLDIVDQTFSTVFSSHTIEHQPDLLGHLKQVARLLEDGGRYHLIIPDRRYCFDRFNPESTLAEVLKAHGEQRQRHSEAAIRAHIENVTHNNALAHWLGSHGEPLVLSDKTRQGLADSEVARAEAGEYVDVHAWVFTPQSFLNLMRELRAHHELPFAVESVSRTRFGEQEFFARLRKTPIAP